MVRLDQRGNSIITQRELAALGASDMVYIREIDADSVRDEIERNLPDAAAFTMVPGTKLYAVCAADGTRVAIADSREAAFATAWQHAMTPVSAH